MSPATPGLLDTLDEWTQSPWAPCYLWFGTNVLHVAIYWGMALPLAYFDLQTTPSIITPYKVRNTRRQVVITLKPVWCPDCQVWHSITSTTHFEVAVLLQSLILQIQPGANRPLKAKVLRRVIARVLFNQLILGMY